MIETVDEKGICPFTLESVEDCHSMETVDGQRICPFSLEKCLRPTSLSVSLRTN